MNTEKYYLGMDIGGTKCAVSLGKAGEDGRVVLLVRCPPRPTAQYTPEAMLNALCTDAGALISKAPQKIQALGISCGGPLDVSRGLILSPPNLPGWDEIPIVEHMSRQLGIPTYLCNDANAGALAEWKLGAGQGCSNMAFLTFGTGLGAGLILNGRLYEGASGFAGEIGHIRLSQHGPSGYGKIGSFEGFCSGGGIAQLAQIYVRREYQKGNRPAFCPKESDIPGLTAETTAKAAQAGDPLAQEIMAQCGTMLGRGLAVLMDILNPERIIIGSIFARARAELWPAAREVITREGLLQTASVCQVLPAALSESVGDLAALTTAAYFDNREVAAR